MFALLAWVLASAVGYAGWVAIGAALVTFFVAAFVMLVRA